MSSQTELIIDARNGVGDSPVWHAVEQALCWTDIPARKLWRWTAATAVAQSWDTPEMLACMAPGPDAGSWIAGMETGVFVLKPQAGEKVDAQRVAIVAHARDVMLFNDGRCDRQGRFPASTMLIDMTAGARIDCVYSYQKTSGLVQLLDGFITPNGMAFSPDGRTMYLSDSHPSVQLIWVYDYNTQTGIPSDWRVFADTNSLPGRPDGAAVDEDGCYWICGNDAGLIHRFTPQGKLDRSLAVPVKKPAMCAFGGAGLETLFVTSIPSPPGVPIYSTSRWPAVCSRCTPMCAVCLTPPVCIKKFPTTIPKGRHEDRKNTVRRRCRTGNDANG